MNTTCYILCVLLRYDPRRASHPHSLMYNYGVWVLHKCTAGTDMRVPEYTQGSAEFWLKWRWQ